MKNVKKIALGALNFILSVAIVICFALSALSYLGANIFTNSELYVKNVLTDEFYDAVYDEVESYVRKATASVVTIEESAMKEVLDREQIRNIAEIYASNFIYRIFDGKAPEEIPQFSSEKMKNLVRDTIYNGITDAGFEISEEQLESDSSEAYELLRGYVDSSVKFIPSMLDGVISKAGEVVSRLVILNTVFTVSVIALAVLVIAKILINFRRGVGSCALSAVAPMWISSAFCFAPFAVLYMYDVTSRLAVTPGTSLYIYLCNAINTALGGGLSFTLTVFVILTVLLIASVVLASFVKLEKTAEENK